MPKTLLYIMSRTGNNIFISVIVSLFLSSCNVDLCDDGNDVVFFDDFQNRLKIDPGYFEMASEVDTIGFRFFNDFIGFTNGKRLFCNPVKYENYWIYYDSGSSLQLSANEFTFSFDLYFNEEQNTFFLIRKVDGEYLFYDQFSNDILEEYSVEILPSFEYKGIAYRDVTKIQAVENGQLLEVLIFQRENGILTYQNFTENYQYNQIQLEQE